MMNMLILATTIGLVSLGQANAAPCASTSDPADKIAGAVCDCGGTDDGTIGAYCIGTTVYDKCAVATVLSAACACPSAGDEVATIVNYGNGKVCTASGTTTDGGSFGAPADCTAADTPYAGCTVPACTAVDTPYAGCTVPACTAVDTPYAGCTLATCTAVDTPYAGCTVPACTAVDTPYSGCTVPACTAVDTPYAGCTAAATTAAATTAAPSPSNDHDGHDHSPSPATVSAASAMPPASLVTMATMLVAYVMH